MENVIFLIGYMGSGKSTFGKRLAKKMAFSFLDSDEEIEKKTGKSVAQIFSEEGETAFRSLETNWLKELGEKNVVIALGGGTPCYHNNMELILGKGKVVYLELSPKLLRNRLIKSQSNRPLIASLQNDREGLLSYIMQSLKERLPFYKRATIIMRGTRLTTKQMDDLIQVLIANDVHSV